MEGIYNFLRLFKGAFRDLLPIILVIAFFQVVVLQQPFPNLAETLAGLVFVVAGMAFFIQGLEMGLFPIGESLARAFAAKGSLIALFAFAFCLGFGTTVAEPALIAVTAEAAKVAADVGTIENTLDARILRRRAALYGGPLGGLGPCIGRPSHPQGLAHSLSDHRWVCSRCYIDLLCARRDRRNCL